MRIIKSIRLKAAFLLTVFALNTVVAFACSLGLNMGYNEKHHDNVEKEKVASAQSHSHPPGTKPHQHNTAVTHSHESTAKHSHSKTASHNHHNAAAAHHHEQSNSKPGDCCTSTAIKFRAEDKKLQQSLNIALKAPVFVAFLSAFLGFKLSPVEAIAVSCKYLVPQYYPPPDIRVAIQSFQI